MQQTFSAWEFQHLRLEDLFANPKLPIHLDLGTGLGHFTEEMLRREPQSNWLAVDYDAGVAKRAAKRITRVAQNNAVVIYADARLFLLELIPTQYFQHIWINFPDPWPKDRHQDRRHSNPRMLNLLCSRLRTGGELHLATDAPNYFEEFSERVQDIHALSQEGVSIRRQQLDFHTKYERKWLAAGKHMHYMDWRKLHEQTTNLEFQISRTIERQPAPKFPAINAPVSPRTISSEDNARCIGKTFPADQKNPNRQRFLLVDSYYGIECTGCLDFSEKSIALQGCWTEWKLGLFQEMFRENT